jgi:hypothetical protein
MQEIGYGHSAPDGLRRTPSVRYIARLFRRSVIPGLALASEAARHPAESAWRADVIRGAKVGDSRAACFRGTQERLCRAGASSHCTGVIGIILQKG